MPEISLNPYLNFDGNTRQAMEFYAKVFGGKLSMQTFGEASRMPGGEGMPLPQGYADKIMHARLDAEGLTIMASEGPPGAKVNVGNNVSLSLIGDDAERLTRWFNVLADGGTVVMPLGKQFWGATFGMLTDRFGIHWMVNIG